MNSSLPRVDNSPTIAVPSFRDQSRSAEKPPALHDSPAYWDGFSGHELDAAVIDPNDTSGHKNRYISALRNAAVLEVLTSHEPQFTVLDYGCGTGSLIEALSRDGLCTFGVDISHGLLTRCRDRQLREPPRVVQADGTHIPFRDGSFDAITVYIVLMYLTDNSLLLLLREMARVLKPGGRVIIIEQFRRRGRFIFSQGKLHRDLGSFLRIAECTEFMTHSTTICRYGHSPLIYLIRIGWISHIFYARIIALERYLGRILGMLPWDYMDVRIILDKPSRTSTSINDSTA